MKKAITILLIMCMVFALVSCTQKMSDEEILKKAEEIKSTKATPEPEPELPQYKKEGIYGNSLFITIIPPYTDEALWEIVKNYSYYNGVYFFLPEAPKKDYNDSPSSRELILPDKDYCIVRYSKINGEWEKFN